LLRQLEQCTAGLNSDWREFKEQFEKSYSSEEDAFRKTIFAENMKKIQEHNEKFQAGIVSFDMGMNEFADLTEAEYALKMARGALHDQVGRVAFAQNFTSRALPTSVNWVEFGFRNPIINQGTCGSCYTFAAVAALEGQYYIKHKQLIQLSQQELLDCTKPYGNYGCGGGFQRSIYNYILANGIGYAASNPYRGVETQCVKNQPRITISTFYEIPSGNEEALKQAVATVGPIPIDMDASLDTFRFYNGGLYYDQRCTTNKLTHAITVVGYGTMQDGQDYWLVRNSWGAQWGVNGYIYMARNRNNACGVATRSVYPIVN